jgi:hypothetical protein
VFLDADVSLAPGTLDGARRAAGRRSGHDSSRCSRTTVTVAAHEQASLLFNVVALMGAGSCTPCGRPGGDARGVRTGARRPARATYDAIGGHAHPDVRAAVLEDIALARRVRRSRPVRRRPRRHLVPHVPPFDLGQVVEGWTKGDRDRLRRHTVVGGAGRGRVGHLARGRLPDLAVVRARLAGCSSRCSPGGSVASAGGRWPCTPRGCCCSWWCWRAALWRRRRGGEVTWKGRALRPDQETRLISPEGAASVAASADPADSAAAAACGRDRRRRRARQEHPLAVEAQLGDALADVVERPVRAHLVRPTVGEPRVPAAHELLHAAHVDAAVVQPVLDVGQVGVEEAAVHPDRVAAQRHLARLGHPLLDELERLGAGVGER